MKFYAKTTKYVKLKVVIVPNLFGLFHTYVRWKEGKVNEKKANLCANFYIFWNNWQIYSSTNQNRVKVYIESPLWFENMQQYLATIEWNSIIDNCFNLILWNFHVCLYVSVCLCVHNGLPKYACHDDETFTGDSMGLE